MINEFTPPGSLPGSLQQSVEELSCSVEETMTRLSFCKNCSEFRLNEYTYCNISGCHINLMTTMQFKTCPKGNW